MSRQGEGPLSTRFLLINRKGLSINVRFPRRSQLFAVDLFSFCQTYRPFWPLTAGDGQAQRYLVKRPAPGKIFYAPTLLTVPKYYRNYSHVLTNTRTYNVYR